jgi:hypothetical protein
MTPIDNRATDVDFTTNKNPLKKAHCISNRVFVVIDETLVKRLQIDESNTWFEQEPTENGILLKIHKTNSQQHTGLLQ